MSRPVTVQVQPPPSFEVNAQILLLVAFLGLVIYLVFGNSAGKKKSGSANTEVTASAASGPTTSTTLPPPAGSKVPLPPVSAPAISPGPGTARTAACLSSAPLTGQTVPPSPVPLTGQTVPPSPRGSGVTPLPGPTASPAPAPALAPAPGNSTPRPRRSSAPEPSDEFVWGDPTKLRPPATGLRPSVMKQRRNSTGGATKWDDRVLPNRVRTITPRTRVGYHETAPGKARATVHDDEVAFGEWKDVEYVDRRDRPNYEKMENRPKWRHGAAMTQDYHGDKLTTETLLRGLIDDGLLDHLRSVERIAKYATRLNGPADLKRFVGPLTLASIGRREVAEALNPLADEWDPAWGALPRLALGAAAKIAQEISPDASLKVEMSMKERCMLANEEKAKRDADRDWLSFVVRAQPRPISSQTLPPYRLCVGWFADYYRTTARKRRMNVNDDDDEIVKQTGQIIRTVKMTKVLGTKVANLLRWLEAMGCWIGRYRLFTPTGVDIIGNGGRMAVNGTFDQEKRIYYYEKTLTIFMWSEGEAHKYWLRRMSSVASSYDAGLSALEGGLSAIEDERPPIKTECLSIRLVFRPGFTVEESTAAVNQQWHSVDRTMATNAPVDRKPVVYRYNEPSELWKELVDDSWSNYGHKIITHFKPEQVTIMNVRQNKWASKDAASQPGLNRDHLLAILSAVGPALLYNRKILRDTMPYELVLPPDSAEMTQLDLTCHVPLVKRAGTRNMYDFFPLDEFPSIRRLAVPYMPQKSLPDNADPSSVDLITDEARGIWPYLSQPDRASNSQGDFTLYVTMQNANEQEQFLLEMTHFLMMSGKHAMSRAPATGLPGGTESRGLAWLKSYMDGPYQRVHIVNAESAARTNLSRGEIKGKPLSTFLDQPRILAAMTRGR